MRCLIEIIKKHYRLSFRVLLTLGVTNIYLGPTLPAFVSPNILKAIIEKWNVTPISTPEADLKKILG